MRIIDTVLKDVKVLENEEYLDNRGFSYISFNLKDLKKAGLSYNFKEERTYYSSKAGTLYGIHFQNNPKAQTKIVFVTRGRGIDYAVDLRKDSPTYLKWVGVELSETNHRGLYIPKGFGHAFLSLEDNTINVLQIDVLFNKKFSRRIKYNDPTIGLKIPVEKVILSAHDIVAPLLKDCDTNL